ncbi:GerAB/ArcD/ProY family transporter [Clostridium sp. AWRP]|uniref:GerAB/ArcD/ProY family transporter n=1 Tax=Clostridium sp. AWRP TaxID=2212991 RepID=UPI000FDBE44C|nr:GerAB/ArcD/ProY family transporter [Clostridium sp. AWRP]AZV56612.1 spore gernimation protein GerK [Clostridium sp. AWRP]
MTNLSNHQLFTLMFIFEVGSTTLFALGINAKQDAWIVILIALLIGLVFVWIYTELQNAFPDKNYAEIIIDILGKFFGIPLILFYVLDCLWHTARNLREFGELINLTTLPETPLWIILFLFLSVSVYTLLKGVETLARASEIIFPILIIFMLSIYILIYISGNVDFKKLTPVLGNGIKPIFASLPSVVMFPFGEIFVFLMYWHYSNDKSSVRKTTIKAILSSGILLCFSLIMDISVLGPKFTSITTIPFVETLRLINIGNIITNIDAIGIIIIFFGGFFKMSIYLYAIITMLTTVFKIKSYKSTLILFSAFLLWFSVAFEPSYAYHIWMFPFDVHYFTIIYSNIFPFLLLMIYWLKKKRANL